MSVYEKLLLSTGGGIVSSKQQADQVANTATLLIGLGGTGVHCIRTIKTQVYDRLIPDNPGGVNPEYAHIRFIGVDSDNKSLGGNFKGESLEESKRADEILSLSVSEFLPIGNQNIRQILKNVNSLKKREELSWLEYDKISAVKLTDAGAGGIRQVGRLLMMDKSQDFMTKVEQELAKAKRGLKSPHINVHIFSGLSGGTGSGCFLDVCYMIRSVLDSQGGNIYGYFFLPDVNLDNIPFSVKNVREYIPKNGYAAMQELDYCMRIQQNGGSFTQTYQNKKTVRWDRPPVDMCHLICATDKDNNVIPNAYMYAMNVTAEYILDMLTYSEKFGFEQHLANFVHMTSEADEKKTIGAEMAYCAIGASCTSIPLREINTYLASGLFGRFESVQNNVPTQAEVEEFMISAVAKGAKDLDEAYEFLKEEMKSGIEDTYDVYPDSWKDVWEGDAEFTKWYTGQTAHKLGRAEENARSMTAPENKQSLIQRIRTELVNVICDIEKGPIYAYRLFSAAESNNLLNVVKGWNEINKVEWEQCLHESKEVRENYVRARNDFLDYKRAHSKRFEYYEECTIEHEKYKIFLGPRNEIDKKVAGEATGIYQKLHTVLDIFYEQLESISSEYYIKLQKVVSNLISTFSANRLDLAGQQTSKAGNAFNTPLITISDLKETLDKKIAAIHVKGMFDQFMRMFLRNEKTWLEENESEIARLVTDFFINSAFADFAGHTITEYLQDKYNTKNPEVLRDKILDEINSLILSANPLFYFNESIYKENNTSKLKFISYPGVSAPICQAAKMMKEQDDSWEYNPSALTDRIFAMCSACSFPLSAYNNCEEYEKLYYSSKAHGRHYYEGRHEKGMEFADWGRLLPITPQSLIETEDKPGYMVEMLTEARELYERAIETGVINDQGAVCRPDKQGIDALESACAECRQLLLNMGNKDDLSKVMDLKTVIDDISRIQMDPDGYSLPADISQDSPETIKSIQKDYFVSSPALHPRVRKYVQQMEETREKVDMLARDIEKKKGDMDHREMDISNYCQALFTGIIRISGNMVTYEGGKRITKTFELSKIGQDFPYGDISVYQGFLSYCSLENDVKNEVIEKTSDFLNKDEDEIAAYIPAIKKELSEKRVKAWRGYARRKANADEICGFLADMMDEFELFCDRYEEQED